MRSCLSSEMVRVRVRGRVRGRVRVRVRAGVIGLGLGLRSCLSSEMATASGKMYTRLTWRGGGGRVKGE